MMSDSKVASPSLDNPSLLIPPYLISAVNARSLLQHRVSLSINFYLLGRRSESIRHAITHGHFTVFDFFLFLPFSGALGGLHLLPVYPSSGDGGFAPLTYKEIDPEMGTWEDIERLSKKYELLMECM